MKLFVAGGQYSDSTTEESFFSILEDNNGQPVVSQDLGKIFPMTRSWGHVYQVCRRAKHVKLICASEQAEVYAIGAPVFAKIPESSRRGILKCARNLLDASG